MTNLQTPEQIRTSTLEPFQRPTEHLPSSSTRVSDLMLVGDAMDRMIKFAEMMAKGSVSVPRHLLKNPSDCLAVVMQATQWGMNPFAVAQKTHLTPGGTLGYEAQLISAVVTENAPVTGFPRYEFVGDWSKVLGKVKECESKNEGKGKYYVATYTKQDEEGLGVDCILTIRGEDQPRVLRVMMSQCYPRFSTQWATDPAQQICYVAIRKWARLNTPGVILGVHTADDDIMVPGMVDMGPADVVGQQHQAAPVDPAVAQLEKSADEAAKKGVAAYSEFWANTPGEDRLKIGPGHARRKEIATEADAKRTVDATPKAATPAPAPAAAPKPAPKAAPKATGAPGFTAEEVRAKMKAARDNKDTAALELAADLIGMVPEGERGPLGEEFEEMLVEIS